MNDFTYQKAEDAASAVASLREGGGKYLGGGTNLIDLMRENIEKPPHLVDVTGLSREIVETADGGLRIGAAVSNTDLANHPAVKSRYPVLSLAIVSGASGQIRNMATVAGNILQRTRCHYFYDSACRCNKRQSGSGCDAIGGFNRMHAILGASSSSCIATHPSDMAVALSALEAVVHVRGPEGEREIAFSDFHRLPGDRPELETNLRPQELITAITVPRCGFASRSTYLKIRDRSSYAFALVSVAAAIKLEGESIGAVRLALGGVAHRPWRAHLAERSLRSAPANESSFRRAAEAELAEAQGYGDNNFKIELAKRAIVQALKSLTEEAKEAAQ